MNIQPIGERVLIKPLKTEERTVSGIYLPESAREGKKQGIVEACGTLQSGKLIPLIKGDKVLYGGYSNEEFEIDNEKYIMVEFKDILAKLN